MSELPAGWVKSPMGDLVNVIRGVTFPASSKVHEVSDGVVACLRTSHIQEKLIWDNIYFIPKQYVRRQEQLTQRNDILMSMANSANLVGKVSINETDEAACFGAFLAAIRCNEVDYKYVYYFLRSSDAQSSLRSTASQTVNIANISVAELEKLKVPLPPLAEQKRIAQKLDALLAQVDTLKARINAIPALLKRFRQSTLAAAFSARLTGEAPAEFDHWQEAKFSSVIEDLRYGTAQKCDYNGGTTGVLRIPNIGDRGIVLRDMKSSDFSETEIKKLELMKGDIVLIRSNGSVELVGKSALVSEKEQGLLFAGYLIRIRLDQAKSIPEFVNYWLKSPAIRQVIEQIARSTSGVNNINSDEIKSLTFTFPSLSAQAEIVRRVEQLFACADQLEAKVATAQQRIDGLTQSLLAKAFRGELVPQDPSDEPASVLLERIRTQRAATPKPKRGRKATTS
ncbi:restriction endonuclease subunit S [Xanthomonas arboricola]|uniref:restriction endonuclease subunit S n=1 Tax=Xanthomonas arboricola TaxID=56448 RepID=UPI0011AF1D72|nr:restriction endonuclease subunit S [Xanthomonas arboricola]